MSAPRAPMPDSDLRRTVRFAINPDQRAGDRGANSFAGSPAARGLARHYEIDATCRGPLDPVLGYVIDIKDIDQAVRDAALPLIAQADPESDPARLLPDLFQAVAARLSTPLRALRWWLTPYYSVEMCADAPARASIRQRFDFAASHRLHVPALSDEENRRRFGKCNHPSGHGHNYRLEPCVEVALNAGPALTLDQLERLTIDAVIQRFDHKNLNIDTAEFADGRGLNPTVENIARVCFDLLAPAIAAASPSARLRSVTVWETDRTSCTYPA